MARRFRRLVLEPGLQRHRRPARHRRRPQGAGRRLPDSPHGDVERLRQAAGRSRQWHRPGRWHDQPDDPARALHRALRDEAVQPRHPDRPGQTARRAEDTATGVLATFEDGTDVRRGDARRCGWPALDEPAAHRSCRAVTARHRAAQPGRPRHDADARPDAGHLSHDLREAGVFRLHRPAIRRGLLVCERRRRRTPADGPVSAIGPALWKERLRQLFAERCGTGGRDHRRDRGGSGRLSDFRHAGGAAVARRTDGHHRRRGARHVAQRRPGRVAGDRRCRRAGQVPARRRRCRARRLPFTSGSAAGGSSGWCATRRGSAAPNPRDRSAAGSATCACRPRSGSSRVRRRTRGCIAITSTGASASATSGKGDVSWRIRDPRIRTTLRNSALFLETTGPVRPQPWLESVVPGSPHRPPRRQCLRSGEPSCKKTASSGAVAMTRGQERQTDLALGESDSPDCLLPDVPLTPLGTFYSMESCVPGCGGIPTRRSAHR